jgi:hypothetical protein
MNICISSVMDEGSAEAARRTDTAIECEWRMGTESGVGWVLRGPADKENAFFIRCRVHIAGSVRAGDTRPLLRPWFPRGGWGHVTQSQACAPPLR